MSASDDGFRASASVDGGGPATGRRPESAATAMLRHARASYSIVRDAGTNALYAIPCAKGDPVPLERLAPAVARAFERETGTVPSSAARQHAIEVIADEDAPVVQVTAAEPTVADVPLSFLTGRNARGHVAGPGVLEDEAGA